jgi:phage shock protein C
MERKFELSKDAKIAGVCGGIAEYFNMEPMLVRIAYVLISLFTGFVLGLVAYLVIYLIAKK